MSEPRESLSSRMRGLAAAGHPRASELLAMAKQLRTLAAAMIEDKSVESVQVLADQWKLAAALWKELTGEDLTKQ